MRHVYDFRRWVTTQLIDLQADVAATRRAVLGIPTHLRTIERLIVATAAELVTAFNEATDEVAADLADLREQLRLAVADKDQAVQDAVEQVLVGFDAPLARLQELGADPAQPVPPVEPPVDEPTG